MKGVMMASFCLCCTFIVSTSGFLSGCSARTGPSQSRISEMHSPTPSPTVELPPGNQAGQLRRSSVREVDFRNFTFPWPEDMIDPSSPERTFTMREGERPETRDKRGHVAGMGVSLSDPIYGDVTGDGVEEAILLFDVLSGGSAQANMVYVYAWRVGRPKLLWSFTTGDRADEGLRSVYAENGNLVVVV